ncbi:MAG: permease [Chromatiales bacterium]|nr:permease [Chromatiales bacterium]
MRRAALVFLLMLVALLLAGTLKVGLLTNTYATFDLPICRHGQFPGLALSTWFLTMPAKGEEGVTAQGAILIGLLASDRAGLLERHREYPRRLQPPGHGFAMGLVGLTLLTAAVGMSPHAGGLDVLDQREVLWRADRHRRALGWMLKKRLSEDETARLRCGNPGRFVKQIFPLLVVGVFAVGVIRVLIQPEWIEALAGQNTLLGNLAGVVFGVFMYFPTLVEVPIAQMFLSLGMHRGPLLAYLMADPELSLQSILIISTIIGRLKAWVYVGWVALFSTLAGLIYGAWVDGTARWVCSALYLACADCRAWNCRSGSSAASSKK